VISVKYFAAKSDAILPVRALFELKISAAGHASGHIQGKGLDFNQNLARHPGSSPVGFLASGPA
jgi:hypothetical protein